MNETTVKRNVCYGKCSTHVNNETHKKLTHSQKTETNDRISAHVYVAEHATNCIQVVDEGYQTRQKLWNIIWDTSIEDGRAEHKCRTSCE